MAQLNNNRALHLVSRQNDQLGLAEYHKIQGILEAHQLHPEQAGHHFHEAIILFEKCENRLGNAEESHLLAKLLDEEHENNYARAWYQKARNLYSELKLNDKVTLIDERLHRSSG